MRRKSNHGVIEKRHKKFFDIIYEIADTVEPVSNARVVAAIVYKGHIISVGINRKKSHPFQAKYAHHPSAIFLHAETDVILSARRTLSDKQIINSTMYICRAKETHERQKVYGLSKPCTGCQDAINTYGIKHVYYTVDNFNLKYQKL